MRLRWVDGVTDGERVCVSGKNCMGYIMPAYIDGREVYYPFGLASDNDAPHIKALAYSSFSSAITMVEQAAQEWFARLELEE